MAEISAGLVKELRELTGLGMMECKKALTEAGDDVRAAALLALVEARLSPGKAEFATWGLLSALVRASATPV